MAAAKSAAPPAVPAGAFLERMPERLPACVVAAGAEAWLRDQVVEAILARVFPEGDPGGGVLVLDARDGLDRPRVAEAVEELRAGSLFGAGRVVVVKNPEALRAGVAVEAEEDAEEQDGDAAEPAAAGGRVKSPLLTLALPALEAAIEGSVLVLSTAKPVKGQGAVPAATLGKAGALLVDCRALYDAPGPWERSKPAHDHELARHLSRRAQSAHRKSLGLVEAHALAQRVGSELGDLEQALETLALHAAAKREIALADIEACFTARREDRSWDLVNAVLEGRRNEALERLEQALAHGLSDAQGRAQTRPEALFAIVNGALFSGWRKILAGAEGLARGDDPAAIVRAAGLPPFRADEHLARCRRDPVDWQRRHAAFLEAERGVKGGGVPPEAALERLVIALTERAAAVPPRG